MDLDFSDADDRFRAEVRAFLAERLPARWVGIFHGDDAIAESNRVTAELAERGWLTQAWPAEYGGHDASVWRQTVLQEELWAHHEPRGGQYMGVNWIGPSIIRFGTEAQRQELLPEIAEGRAQWAQLFSEPDAGSDLAAISTWARGEGDRLVVNGEKIWTSYANYATRGFLVARTEPSSTGKRGLSVLLIDMETPGIEVREIGTPLGRHKLNSVVFRDVEVPAAALLGELHDGWRVAMTALAFERSGSARYARSTRIIGYLRDLRDDGADSPAAAERMAEALAFGRAAELMNYSVVAIKERGEVPTWEASAARTYNALYEREVAALADWLLGEEALVGVDDPEAPAGGEIEEFIRGSVTPTVSAGTYEIQLGIIATRGLGLARSY